jgi:serine/threonine protein kinase
MPAEVTRVGPYTIERLVGEGAASKVYRARAEDGSVVALKLLDRLSGADDRFRRRFLRESDIARHIDHPHVVPTIASGDTEGRLWLAMELVDGVDLRSRLRADGRLEPQEAVAVVEQIASALDAAHAEGLVHRDVKPGNILLSGDRALICDFGLARHVSSVSSLTGDRGFVGTIDYVPPEQIEGGDIDGRAAAIPRTPVPALSRRLVSRRFRPRVVVRVPATWHLAGDTTDEYRVASPSGTTIDFRLDPFATSVGGSRLAGISATPTSLAAWLQRDRALRATPPQALYTGRQVFQTLFLGVHATTRTAYFTFAGSPPVVASPGHHARVYLTPVRLSSITHTLAIIADAPSPAAFRAALPTVAAVVKNMTASAAPAGILTAFSSLCTPVWQGTCRGETPPGTYTSRSMRPKLTYTVPLGWTNSVDKPGAFGLIPPGGDFSAVDTGGSDYIDVFTSIASANGRCPDGNGIFHTPEMIIGWVRTQPGIAPFTARPASIGGLTGYVVDLRLHRGFTAKCFWSGPFPGQQAITGLGPSPDGLNHSLPPGHAVMRLYLLHYGRGTLAIEMDDVRDDARLAEYDRVVRTFKFGQG